MIFTNLSFLHKNYNLRTLFVFRTVSLVFKAIISGHIQPADWPLRALAVNILILYTTNFLTSLSPSRSSYLCLWGSVRS